MRILQISNKAPYPPNDGSSIAIYNMGIGFIANEVELHLLTVNTKKHFKPDEKVTEEYRERSHYKSVYRDADVSTFGAFFNLFSSQSYFVSRFYFKEYEKVLIEKLKSTNFDIIQVEGLFMATYLPVIRKYSKAKLVLRAHNVEYLIWERHLKNERSALKRIYLKKQTERLKKFEMAVLSCLDVIVTITDVDKKVFERLGFKKPIVTCITGVDVAAYETKRSDVVKPRTIFHFASMDWMPNQEAVDWFLEKCWPTILKAMPDSKFVIAGRYMPQRFLKLNLPNVLVIEKVADSKVFYNEHQIMLVPLLSGSGLRIKIIEGMAYGKAIVSTSIGAEGIRVTSGKNIVIADDPEQFSKAIIDLLTHDALRNRLEIEAREFARQEFDNQKVVFQLVEFYKSILHV
jgi:glycosyltransferase involved in cell wall biosynthesis